MRGRWATTAIWLLSVTWMVVSARADAGPVRGTAVAVVSTGRLAVGDGHSCAIQTNNLVACWGDNQYQQYTPPPGSSQTYSMVPVQLAGLAGGRIPARIVAGSSHTCVLATDQTVWCWGDNGNGQLGTGSFTSTAVPTQVSVPDGATTIAAGGQNTCALSTTGALYCWGSNAYNQLAATSAVTQSNAPLQVGFPSAVSIAFLAVGKTHACVVETLGKLWCWGNGGLGRLGKELVGNQETPDNTVTFAAATKLSAGAEHTCVSETGGSVWCWGNGAHNRLGALVNAPFYSPTPLKMVETGAVAVGAGERSTCVMFASGVNCAGANYTGLQSVGGLTGSVVDLAVGAYHACAVLAPGEVRCWGKNTEGQLGVGNDSDNYGSAGAVGSLSVATTTTEAPTTVPGTSATSAPGTTTTVPIVTTTVASSQTTPTTAPTTTVAPGSTWKGLKVKKGRTVTAAKVARFAKMTIPTASKGKMRISIVKGSKNCAFKGSRIKGVRRGTCRVRLVLIPKVGPVKTRTVPIRVI